MVCEEDLTGEIEVQGWVEENANELNGSEYVERHVFRRSLVEEGLSYENATVFSEDLVENYNETMLEINGFEWQVGSFGPV